MILQLLVTNHASRMTHHVSSPSSAYEMHDFYSVTFRNRCRVPPRPAYDSSVQFNCESMSVQTK